MDIEFIVQDIFSLTRPQWKLALNLEEASRAFQMAVAQDQKNSGLNKPADAEEAEIDESSDEDGERALPEAEHDAEEDSTTEEEIDVGTLSVSLMAPINIFPRL
jgi:regulator of nonsense transcripts 2